MSIPDYGFDLPQPHAEFLRHGLARLQADERLVAVAAGGSFLTKSIDEYSDLDLVIAVEPDAYDAVMKERHALAAGLGSLLAAFTGEHVGEPRVLICLYGPLLLHVDLKFVRLADAALRVEDPVILWERDGRLSAVLLEGTPRFPAPDLQWIEDRFWIWVHYGAAKIGRGELFEVHDSLAFLRSHVLGPLALMARGARPTGVRRLERAAPDLAEEMRLTMATYDRSSCAAALRAAAEMYRKLRAELARGDLVLRGEAEKAALEYLAGVAAPRDRRS